MTIAVLLRSGMTRKCHVPFCRAVGGATLSLTLIFTAWAEGYREYAIAQKEKEFNSGWDDIAF